MPQTVTDRAVGEPARKVRFFRRGVEGTCYFPSARFVVRLTLHLLPWYSFKDPHTSPLGTFLFLFCSLCKRLHVWCFRDIPVDFKYIAEPSMHSMPAVALHPNSKLFRTACIQSLLSEFLPRRDWTRAFRECEV